jgi:hypothetical protein
MKKEKIKTFKKSTLCLRLKAKEIDIVEKLRLKLSINTGSKALLKAAELIVTRNYDSEIIQLKNDVELWKTRFYKLITAIAEKQNSEKIMNSFISSYLPELKNEFVELDKAEATYKELYIEELQKNRKQINRDVNN